jgi:hypothetical protein
MLCYINDAAIKIDRQTQTLTRRSVHGLNLSQVPSNHRTGTAFVGGYQTHLEMQVLW